jgi:hypothetical protein
MELTSIIPTLEWVITNRYYADQIDRYALDRIAGQKSPALNKKVLNSAIENKIITAGPDPLFTSQDKQLFFYALYFAGNPYNELQTREGVVNFFTKTRSRNYHESLKNFAHKVDEYLLLILNRVFNVNIPAIIASGTIQSKIVKHAYWDLLPFMVATVDELISGLYIATEGIKAEGNYINLNASVRLCSKNNIDFGKKLLDACKLDKIRSDLFYPHAFSGLTSAIGVKQSFGFLKQMLLSAKHDQQITGLHALSMLHGYEDRPEEIEKDLIPILESIESKKDDQLSRALIYVYGLLIEKLPNAKEKLYSIPFSQKGKDTCFALSHIVMLKTADHQDEDWYKNALVILTNLRDHHVGTYGNLGMAFANNNKKSTELFFTYINGFISETNNPIRNLEAFKYAFETAIQHDNESFLSWITLSLNREQNRFHQAVSIVLLKIDRALSNAVVLSETILNTLNQFDIEYILFKIVGNVVSKENLQQLVFSALKYKDESKLIEQIVKELFCLYIVYNYPGSIKFIREKRGGASEIEMRVITEVEQHYNDSHRISSQKPLELAPSSERLQQLFKKYSKQLGDFKDDSPFRETSFMDLFTKITLKTGNAYFHRNGVYSDIKNKYKNRSTLNKMSMEFDMPGGEFVDPIGQEYNRYCWRNFKRRVQ